MPNQVVFAEVLIVGDHGVHRLCSRGNSLREFSGKPLSFAPSYETVAKLWRQRLERKAAAQGVIYQCERAISQVHRSDNVHVCRNIEWRLARSRIRQPDRILGFALVRLQQGQQLAEDLARVSSIYLLDN